TAAGSTAAAVTAAAITRIFPSRRVGGMTVPLTWHGQVCLDCSARAAAVELIRVHDAYGGLLLSVRPRESGDPDSKILWDWIPAYAGMSGGETHTRCAPSPASGGGVGRGWHA